MLPACAVLYPADYHVGHAELSGNPGLCKTSSQQLLDFTHRLLVQFGIFMRGPFWTKSIGESMIFVLRGRNILQICKAVVAFVAILMIDLIAIRAWTGKGQHHKVMNEEALYNSGDTQTNRKVICGDSWPQYSSLCKSGSTVFQRNDAIHAADSSEAGSLVITLKAWDVFPYFLVSRVIRGMIHRIGLLCRSIMAQGVSAPLGLLHFPELYPLRLVSTKGKVD